MGEQNAVAPLGLDVAEEREAGLIVVGNKGMTGAKRFLLGSVPNKVSHHAPCSVLIIRTSVDLGPGARDVRGRLGDLHAGLSTCALDFRRGRRGLWLRANGAGMVESERDHQGTVERRELLGREVATVALQPVLGQGGKIVAVDDRRVAQVQMRPFESNLGWMATYGRGDQHDRDRAQDGDRLFACYDYGWMGTGEREVCLVDVAAVDHVDGSRSASSSPAACALASPNHDSWGVSL